MKDDDLLDKYNKIWDKIKETLSVKFMVCLFMMKNA